MSTIIIEIEEDFNKLRNYKNNDKIVKIIINSDISFKSVFIPISGLEQYNIYIYGNNHTLSNICINSSSEKTGIISSSNNLYVKDLNIVSSSLIGGVLSGLLCGSVEHEVLFDKVSVANSVVASEAYCGSLVGICGNLVTINSKINSEVRGYDVVGGICGMAGSFSEDNNEINTTIIGIGKALSNDVGFCERKTYDKRLSKRFHF